MRFAEMTWPMIRRVPRSSTMLILPLAACEQHSQHLPTFTDTILTTAIVERVEARLSDQVLLLPTQWLGASHHHLPFGATVSLSADDHANLICHMLEPLLEDGFERVLIVNGHGGNIDPLHMALRRLQPRWRKRSLTGSSYWELAERELAQIAEGARKVMGHACEFETSMMLALRPELVRMEQLVDHAETIDERLRGLFIARDFRQATEHGAIGFPSLASAAKGEAMLEAATTRIVEVIQALLVQPLPVDFSRPDPDRKLA